MQRVKRIYDSKTVAQIAHCWAHQSLPKNPSAHYEASSRTGNFYYSGTVIYSYGRHYPIADIMPDKKGHPKTVLFEAIPYPSQQTHGHRGLVKSAIPSDWQVIEVVMGKEYWSPNGPDIPRNLEFYYNKITELAKLQARARTRDYSAEINKWGKEAKKFIAYFKPKKSLYKKYMDAYNASETFKAHIASDLVEETAKQRERRKEQREKAIETLLGWYRANASDWALQRVVKDPSDVRLRLETDKVYTSKGFHITAAQARAAFNAMRKVRTATVYEAITLDFTDSQGSDWHSRPLNPDGSFHVGCHFITFEEAEALALRSGWITEASILSGKDTLRQRMFDQESLFTPCRN